MSASCWMLKPRGDPIFVLLGRYGDTMLMFPAFMEIYRRIGKKPRVIVSTDFASIYDGISYAQPIPIRAGWWEGVPQARAMAQALADDCCVPQWWNDPCPIPPEYQGTFNLTCHGKNWGVNLALWPNFMASMWERAGFTQQEMVTLPMVFDRRDRSREQALLKLLWPPLRRTKPLLLYNFTGNSSPFGFLPDVYPVIQSFARDFWIVDLGPVRATRLYDLLGCYDAAAGLITSDTATAHLAAASNVPTVWFVTDGWTGSTPRGNVALSIKYNETPRRLDDLRRTLQKWRTERSIGVERPVLTQH